MMNRGKNVALMAAGIMLGATISVPAAQATASILAQRSAQAMDGQRVQMEAYAIGGANYVKLRDVGKAVGFRVSWDGSAVQIDTDAPYAEDTPSRTAGGRIVTIPQSDENFVLKVGDRVRCDDGTLYEIRDMSRYDANVFAEAPLPPLPTPKCDWSLFPQPELPRVEVKRYADQYGDDLFVTNLYELRRIPKRAGKRAGRVARKRTSRQNPPDHPAGVRTIHRTLLAVAREHPHRSRPRAPERPLLPRRLRLLPQRGITFIAHI